MDHLKTHCKDEGRATARRIQKQNTEETSILIEPVEYESFDEGELEEGSSYYGDYDEEQGTNDEQMVSLGNRPVQVKAIIPQATPQPVRLVKAVPQVIRNAQPVASSADATDDSSTVVYNVVPSTITAGNYSYILKFK